MNEIREQQRRDDKQELLDELIDAGDVDYDVEAREFIAKK